MSANGRCRLVALFACACAVLAGCAGSAPPLEPAGPAPLASPSLEPLIASEPESQARPAAMRLLDEQHFHIEVQEADLAGVLLGLGRESPLNVVVGQEVRGRVTADLQDVSLLEILDQLVLPRGYQYEVRGNVLRIFLPERRTRIYRIEYPSYRREGSSDFAVAGAIGSSPDLGGESGGGDDEDVSRAGIQTVQTVDFWHELGTALRSLVLGDGDEDPSRGQTEGEARPLSPRRVLVSPQAGLVTVTAEGRILAEVERYLEELVRSTTRQVLIDAQILEVDLGDELEFGFDVEYAPDNPGSTLGVFERLIIPGLREATLVQQLAPVLTDGGISFGFARNELGLILRAIARQTDLRVVSTPRITTLNNHKALFKVVRNEVFFVAETETEAFEGSGVTKSVQFVPKVVPIGVTLDVTPHVSDDGRILMHIHPSVSEVVSVRLQPTSDPDLPQQGSLPVIDLRETDTVLHVGDGQTIVIGGLVQSREFDLERKVPFLGDIPLLGRVFRSTKAEEKRSELLILLTPSVLDAPRITSLTDEAMSAFGAVEQLQRHRRQEPPWWRRPIGRSYGVQP